MKILLILKNVYKNQYLTFFQIRFRLEFYCILKFFNEKYAILINHFFCKVPVLLKRKNIVDKS